jgi:hypothetical protein
VKKEKRNLGSGLLVASRTGRQCCQNYPKFGRSLSILGNLSGHKSLDELSNGRALLANGDIDTIELLVLILTVIPMLLVENSVDGDGSLASLTVTDDELTLTTTDGHHGVDRFNISHHRLIHGATGENAGGLQRGTTTLSGLNGALSVDGIAKGIDDTTEKHRADRNVDNLTSALDGVTLLDETVIAKY